MHHLQAVLDGAQEGVSLRQLVAGLPRDPAILVEAAQHRYRRAPAQGGAAPTEDELLGLDEELDLADAAAAELDVVAATANASWPRTAWIWRFIAWTSAMAAKSKYLRQTKGVSSARNVSPAGMSPAIGRALMKAARSQFCPVVS